MKTKNNELQQKPSQTSEQIITIISTNKSGSSVL